MQNDPIKKIVTTEESGENSLISAKQKAEQGVKIEAENGTKEIKSLEIKMKEKSESETTSEDFKKEIKDAYLKKHNEGVNEADKISAININSLSGELTKDFLTNAA